MWGLLRIDCGEPFLPQPTHANDTRNRVAMARFDPCGYMNVLEPQGTLWRFPGLRDVFINVYRRRIPVNTL